jgi:hypothetical protein
VRAMVRVLEAYRRELERRIVVGARVDRREILVHDRLDKIFEERQHVARTTNSNPLTREVALDALLRDRVEDFLHVISSCVHTEGVHFSRLHSEATLRKNCGFEQSRSFTHCIAVPTASARPSASDGNRFEHVLPPDVRKRLISPGSASPAPLDHWLARASAQDGFGLPFRI